jgi:hypothetical protein
VKRPILQNYHIQSHITTQSNIRGTAQNLEIYTKETRNIEHCRLLIDPPVQDVEKSNARFPTPFPTPFPKPPCMHFIQPLTKERLQMTNTQTFFIQVNCIRL